MNSKGLLVGVVALCSMLSCPLKAQQDTVSMTLDKVLEVALSDNPSVIVADRTIEIQKYAKRETIAGLFPTASLTAAAVKNIEVATMTMKMGDVVIKAKMGRPYNYSLSSTVSLPLVVPQLWKSISVSQEQVELAVEQARESKVQTISQVKKAFYQYLLVRDSYDVLQASYNTAKENLDNARDMFKYAKVSEYDTLTAYVQMVGIEPNLLSTMNSIKLTEMQLKVLMGMDVNEPVKFVGHLSDYEEKLFSDLMILKDDSNTQLESNSTLAQLDHQKKQLILAEKINKLGYLPTLALQFSAGYSAMPEEFNPFKASFYGSESVTLALQWTLWDGSKLMKTKQNKLQLENLDEMVEQTKRQLELAVESSLNSIETAAEQVVSNKQSVYSAERAFDISQKRYEIGSGTQLEMNASETQRQSARLQYVQSIYEFLSAQASLEETLGKVVTGK